jgi:hypothetical protein
MNGGLKINAPDIVRYFENGNIQYEKLMRENGIKINQKKHKYK